MPDKKFLNLRKEAEQFLIGNSSFQESNITPDDIKILFQELQVHQIELEMQNDELRTANEELENERVKFTGIYDLAPVGYFILNKVGIIEEVNAAGATLLGLYKTSIVGHRMQKFLIADQWDTFYFFFNQLLKTERPQSCRLKVINNNGALLDVQVEGITINNTLLGLRQCYIAVVDITERIASEQRLAETKNRLELALEASKAGTWEYDLITGHLTLDDANFVICGINSKTFDGQYKTFTELIHPDDREKLDSALRVAVNQDKELNVDCRIIKGEDTCFISIRGHVVTGIDKHKRFLGTMTDITDKKTLEEETNRLKIDQHKNIAAAILQAEDNERKRISEALHDSVSQLLYGIKLNLQQLQPDKDNQEALATIHSLLNEAVKETRNISFELAPSVLTDFGLPATIDELAKRLSTPNMQIKTKVTGLSARLNISIELVIFRIIQELLNNAIRHSEANVIKVEIKKNKMLEIEVKDNGKGFNVSEQEYMPGGAGLSSIRNRLNFYNGTINIKSYPGEGTTVQIALKL
jgi:PAS domain S-box-containing protein